MDYGQLRKLDISAIEARGKALKGMSTQAGTHGEQLNGHKGQIPGVWPTQDGSTAGKSLQGHVQSLDDIRDNLSKAANATTRLASGLKPAKEKADHADSIVKTIQGAETDPNSGKTTYKWRDDLWGPYDKATPKAKADYQHNVGLVKKANQLVDDAIKAATKVDTVAQGAFQKIAGAVPTITPTNDPKALGLHTVNGVANPMGAWNIGPVGLFQSVGNAGTIPLIADYNQYFGRNNQRINGPGVLMDPTTGMNKWDGSYRYIQPNGTLGRTPVLNAPQTDANGNLVPRNPYKPEVAINLANVSRTWGLQYNRQYNHTFANGTKLTDKTIGVLGVQGNAALTTSDGNLKLGVNGMVGAKVTQVDVLERGPASIRNIATAQAGADAELMVGLKATENFNADVGGVGAGVNAEGWVGAGVEANVTFGKGEDGKWTIGGKFGAGLGIGGKLGAQITIDPPKIKKTVTDVAHKAGDLISKIPHPHFHNPFG
jgi:uncharacterized protein YukE